MSEIKKEIWEMLKDFHIKNIRDYSLLWWICLLGSGIIGASFFIVFIQIMPFLLSVISGIF